MFNLTPYDDFSFYFSFSLETIAECNGFLSISTNLAFTFLTPTMWDYQPKFIDAIGGLNRFIFRVYNHGLENITNTTSLYFQINVGVDHTFSPLLNSIQLSKNEINQTYIPEWVVSMD